MSMFSKFTDLARKALDTLTPSSGIRGSSATDWREILRQAKSSLAGQEAQRWSLQVPRGMLGMSQRYAS